MASTWVVGDIHGCAVELQQLLDRIDLKADDMLLSVGDLFHRGPDPVGVLRILQGLGDRFDMVNGNHELVLSKRLRFRAPTCLEDLRGDGGALIDASAMDVAEEMVAFIAERDYVQRRLLTGPAWQDHPAKHWLMVHGCVLPGVPAEQIPPRQLVRKGRRTDLPGDPYWYEHWQGPEFVVFGHAQSAAGFHIDAQGRAWCCGLDTGCVYGKKLSALRIEDLSLTQIPAAS
ncbi:MAG: metallophosphoesterase [Planctomycetota bacterium]|jgi:serine/threonine protein phosphatase 1|nr:metallophosphoesterase [Planctomycetota bacterium]